MISNYTELQSAVASWSYRTDLTALIPDFIALCESDMRTRLKMTDLEAIATIPLTAGVGALPVGYGGHRAVYSEGDLKRPLKYLPPDRFNASENLAGLPTYFTATGGNIYVSPAGDGNVVMTYKAKLLPLTTLSPTNYVLTNYPDAYLHGSLVQLHIYTKDNESLVTSMKVYEDAMARVVRDNNERKYAGPLEVRAS
jgi:hypothetical protein